MKSQRLWTIREGLRRFRVVLLVGALISGLLWLGSVFWMAGWQLANGDTVGIGAGNMWVSHYVDGVPTGTRFKVGAYVIVRESQYAPMLWWPKIDSLWGGFLLIRLPLWIPALILGSLWWWARGARLREGECPKCRYAVAGLTGVCPECGHPIQSDSTPIKS